MSDDVLQSLYALREDLEKAAAPFAKAQRDLPPTTAQDATGSVRVTLDGGGRITDVRVEGAWREQLGEQALGAAVIEALGAAGVERLGRWSQEVAESGEAAPVRTIPPPTSQSVAGQMDELLRSSGSRIPNSALEELLRTLREVNDELEGVVAQVETGLAATHTGRSTSGHVRATVSAGGEPLEIEFDRHWLPRAHSTNLGREALEAVVAAQATAAASSAQQLLQRSAAGRLAALVDDPQALTERFGLRG